MTTFYQVEKDHKRIGLKIKTYINACAALAAGDNDGRRLARYNGEVLLNTVDHDTATTVIDIDRRYKDGQ